MLRRDRIHRIDRISSDHNPINPVNPIGSCRQVGCAMGEGCIQSSAMVSVPLARPKILKRNQFAGRRIPDFGYARELVGGASVMPVIRRGSCRTCRYLFMRPKAAIRLISACDRACVVNAGGKWYYSISFVEVSASCAMQSKGV